MRTDLVIRSDREIGERLRRQRGERSQKQVLQSLRGLGIKLPALAIARIESGERSLKFTEALGLAIVYGVSIDRLAMDSGDAATDLAQTHEDRRAISELRSIQNQISDRIEVLDGGIASRG